VVELMQARRMCKEVRACAAAALVGVSALWLGSDSSNRPRGRSGSGIQQTARKCSQHPDRGNSRKLTLRWCRQSRTHSEEKLSSNDWALRTRLGDACWVFPDDAVSHPPSDSLDLTEILS